MRGVISLDIVGVREQNRRRSEGAKARGQEQGRIEEGRNEGAE
jgi:hypothetical protein